MTEFLKSNPALDKIVNASTNVEMMREALKRELANTGIIARDPESLGYGIQRLPGQEPVPAPPAAAQPPAEPTCMRVVYVGNNRFEMYGVSETELDEKERQIRAMFSV